MMLSEGSYPEHHLKAFDATYSWNIYHALAPIFNGEKTARALDIELSREEVTFPDGALRMRFSSNHDENAWDASDVEKFGVEGAKLAAVVVNTLPGIPLLYNGQEVGNRKRLGLFEKNSIDWKEGDEFRALYFRLFELRKYQPALFGGEMIRIPSTNDKRLYAFARVSGTNKFIVLYNFDRSPFNGSVDLSSPTLGIGTHVTLTDAFSKQSVTLDIPPTRAIQLNLPGMGFRILQIEQEILH
jgi:glycosidase